MGKSRSASIVIAYMLAIDSSLNPSSALTQLRQARPFAEPNPGFMTQLKLYHTLKCPMNLDDKLEYQRWLYQRVVRDSRVTGVAPDINEIFRSKERKQFKSTNTVDMSNMHEDSQRPATDGIMNDKIQDHGIGALAEQPSIDVETENSRQRTYRCRRCRKPIVTSDFVAEHTQDSLNRADLQISQGCAHIFVDPLSWMKPELEKGTLSGRFECPNTKCSQSIGKYAWQGMKCSCGEWVVPGLSLLRSRIDEVEGNSTIFAST